MKSEFGVVGIGAMGRNLSLNFLDHNISVSAYDISSDQLLKLQSEAVSTDLQVFTEISSFLDSLKSPRKILIMLKAGKVTYDFIKDLAPQLNNDDILIDGGNQHFEDTNNIIEYLKQFNIRFIGAGVSGGTKGARYGPSIMPGGDKVAWEYVKLYLQAIAAKTENNIPCCQWIGPEGAGHFVKMIHNGIEYGDMQLIAEIYDILKHAGLSNNELSVIFQQWNQGKLNSFLLEISSKIFVVKDQNAPGFLVDSILDSAGQKGTGKWSVATALDLGQTLNITSAAVYQRFLSSEKMTRIALNTEFAEANPLEQNPELISKLENALYLSRLIAYLQGFSVLLTASNQYSWKLNLHEIALIWTNGCIIRSNLLKDLMKVLQNTDNILSVSDLVQDSFFKNQIKLYEQDLRDIVILCVSHQIPSPGLFASLSYIDTMSSARLPANLIQAQRDFFGSHSFQLLDGSGPYTKIWE